MLIINLNEDKCKESTFGGNNTSCIFKMMVFEISDTTERQIYESL